MEKVVKTKPTKVAFGRDPRETPAGSRCGCPCPLKFKQGSRAAKQAVWSAGLL